MNRRLFLRSAVAALLVGFIDVDKLAPQPRAFTATDAMREYGRLMAERPTLDERWRPIGKPAAPFDHESEAFQAFIAGVSTTIFTRNK